MQHYSILPQIKQKHKSQVREQRDTSELKLLHQSFKFYSYTILL